MNITVTANPRQRFLALGLSAALVLGACQSVQTTQPGVVGVERK